MAKKKPKKRPQSAAEKAANANLTRAQQIALAQQGARVKGASKGAFSSRKLRAGGTEMQQYALDRFQNDPFPGLGPGGGPSYGPSGQPAAPQSPKPKPKVKPKPSTGNPADDATSQSPTMEQIRRRAAAEKERQRKAAAAKAAAAAKRKKDKDAGAGTVKPPKGGTGAVMS